LDDPGTRGPQSTRHRHILDYVDVLAQSREGYSRTRTRTRIRGTRLTNPAVHEMDGGPRGRGGGASHRLARIESRNAGLRIARGGETNEELWSRCIILVRSIHRSIFVAGGGKEERTGGRRGCLSRVPGQLERSRALTNARSFLSWGEKVYSSFVPRREIARELAVFGRIRGTSEVPSDWSFSSPHHRCRVESAI